TKGKITIMPKVAVTNREQLSLAYTPGVAEACLEIKRKPEEIYNLTGKGNLVAIVTDGTAVLGLGDIGPEAALPVMEGKAVLFKEFAGIDAFPLCLKTKDVDEIVDTVVRISPVFGAINLEDISAPRCFEVERKLKERLGIPVMHDDQHGTAIVVLAALKNALKLAKKKIDEAKIVVNGIGAAGTAISYLLLAAGAKNIILCDKRGVVEEESFDDAHRKTLIKKTNPDKVAGGLEEALKGADIFIGVSAANIVSKGMIASMAGKPIIFAMANPDPEILPDEARKAGAFIVGTGRSDFPNQINNALGFPGIFRGLLDARATEINEGMLLAAAEALAKCIKEEDLKPDYIIPSPFDKSVVKGIAKAVMESAKK
ncbi:MAG: NADP-dependent malic enzyme, partial [Candidatus Micrarchaeota archaeon]